MPRIQQSRRRRRISKQSSTRTLKPHAFTSVPASLRLPSYSIEMRVETLQPPPLRSRHDMAWGWRARFSFGAVRDEIGVPEAILAAS